MEYRKRPRLEFVERQNASFHCLSSNDSRGTTTTVATIGGQSYILSGQRVDALPVNAQPSTEMTTTIPANILFTICDENSEEESQEILIDSSLITQIKQEHNVATQTSPPPPLLQPSSSLARSTPQSSSLSSHGNCLLALPSEYHLITNSNTNSNNNNNTSEQIAQPKTLDINSNTTILNAPNGCDTNLSSAAAAAAAAANLLTNAVQLPTGCEIYLIKEFLDEPISCTSLTNHTKDNSIRMCNGAEVQNSRIISNDSTSTTVKIETGTQEINLSKAANTPENFQQPQQQDKAQYPTLKSNALITETHHNDNSVGNDDIMKRRCLLETYKKRDDKRRATHNEVERRRRDKINSWIFKLKEMLPADMNAMQQRQIAQHQQAHSVLKNGQILTATTKTATTIQSMKPLQLEQQQQTKQHISTRTPPNDSKSQILIKACEYIKSLQDEIKSLRQCLKENENLRLRNQRLQDELFSLNHQSTTNKNELKQNDQKIGQEYIVATTISAPTIGNDCNQLSLNSLKDAIITKDVEPTTESTKATTYINTESYGTMTATTAFKKIESINPNEHIMHQAQVDFFNNHDIITTNTITTIPDIIYTKRELVLESFR